MNDFDVLVIGGVGVDTIVRVPDLTIPASDNLPVPPIVDYVAHSGNGVALGFQALGLRTKFVDFLGDDQQGELIRRRYAAVGLDFSSLPAPNGTPRSVNLVDASGRRFSFYDGRHPAGLVLPREFYRPLLERTRHAHIGGRDVAAFGEARRLGVTTSCDIHAWDGVAAWAMDGIRQADIVFLSSAAVPEKIDDLMRAILDAGVASLVVATEGEAGSRVLARADGRVRCFPVAEPERPVVDSNGAGDAYSTAFLSRWLAGAEVEECALAGAVSGAFACGARGTHEELIAADALAAAVGRARRPDWATRRRCS